MSGPPSATLNHSYVAGMLRLHYRPAAAAAIFGNILIIAALASKNTMHHVQCFLSQIICRNITQNKL